MDLQAFWRATQLAGRAGVGAGLSAAVALQLDLKYPIYAFIAAVIVTDLSSSRTRQLGLLRLVATVVGAGIGAMLSMALPPGPLALGLGVLIAMLVCHLVHLQEGAKVAGYICGIVLLEHGDHPWSYALFRLIETMLGIAVATAISFVPMLIRIEENDPRKPEKVGPFPIRRAMR